MNIQNAYMSDSGECVAGCTSKNNCIAYLNGSSNCLTNNKIECHNCPYCIWLDGTCYKRKTANNFEPFEVKTKFDARGQCCKGCQHDKECYAFCSPDVISICGKKTNDPKTCKSCPMCMWVNGPNQDNNFGKCVPRNIAYLDQPSFAWSGYAPHYNNLYFSN